VLSRTPAAITPASITARVITARAITARATTTLLALVMVLSGLVLVAPPAAAQEAGEPAFVFTGSGWGHGVGMSQYGARGMATEGLGHPQILAHYYRGTTLGPVAELVDMRVHLDDASEFTVQSSGPLSFSFGGAEILAVTEGNAQRIFAHDGGIQIGDTWVPAVSGTPVVVSYPKPINVSTTGHAYLWGKLELTERSGQVRIVESNLTMEQYVAGIAEMPASWPGEALRAQAIAARTYAENVIQDRRSSTAWNASYDISATTTDQHYIGYDAQDDDWDQVWLEASTSTAGLQILENGVPIRAYYSASSGGHTEAGALVFGRERTHLSPVVDPYDNIDNPWSNWTRAYSVADISRWFDRASDTRVGTAISLEVNGFVGASGRIDKSDVTIVGTDATVTVSGRRLMLVINAGLIAEGAGLSRHLPGTLTTISAGNTATDTDATVASVDASSTNAASADATPAAEVTDPGDGLPIGAIEGIGEPGPQTLISGWAFDPTTPEVPVTIEVTVDRRSVSWYQASLSRPEIANAYPGAGPDHGFGISLELAPGARTVCLNALDTAGGRHTNLTCSVIEVPGEPVAATVDPSPAPTANPEPQVASDGLTPLVEAGAATVVVTTANGSSTVHTIPTAPPAPTPDTASAPVAAAASAPDPDADLAPTEPPVGELEALYTLDGRLTAAGWTYDPDSDGAVAVQIRFDGKAVTSLRAGDLREDITEEVPGAPERTGWVVVVPFPEGTHEVCVVLFNQGAGDDVDLPCQVLAR